MSRIELEEKMFKGNITIKKEVTIDGNLENGSMFDVEDR